MKRLLLAALIAAPSFVPVPAMAWHTQPTPPPDATPVPAVVSPPTVVNNSNALTQSQKQQQRQGQSIGNTSVITLSPVQPGPCGPGAGVFGGGGNNGWAIGGGVTWPLGPKPNTCYPLPVPITNVYVTNPAPQIIYRTTAKAPRKCATVAEVYAGTGRTVKEDVDLMLSPGAHPHTHQEFWDAMGRLVKACVKDP